MPSHDLRYLERTTIQTPGRRGLAVVNVSDRQVCVFVDVWNGSAWNGWRCLDSLEPGDRRWLERTADWGDALRVVVARGEDHGRPIVRVEY